ncbi:Uncharacterised protein [Serratia entomophila]|nr:hypothetical protein 345p2_00096 [Serratia entomophila]ULG18105.1 hypothetical protein LCp2_00003 [Serratia proteamaculans]ULG19086.1 hypothetical protein Sm1ap1_00059 [Serratia proteamaculans]CAI1185144.1 Uncharacterised protein [Serratia entomophila]CAI2153863.1 Uncharacterised protein [Serratia entomophila]
MNTRNVNVKTATKERSERYEETEMLHVMDQFSTDIGEAG